MQPSPGKIYPIIKAMNSLHSIIRIAFALAALSLCSITEIQAQTEEELLESTAEIQNFVTRYRGLDFLQPVSKRIQTKQQTEQFLKQRISEEFSKEEINRAERLLKRLDLLPADYNYYTSMLELMTEQLAGMYDHKGKFLAIADWLPLEMQKPVLAHELTHALQDQHYGLDNYLSPDVTNDDNALALSSLVEGDASLVMFAYSMLPMGEKVTDIPDYVAFMEQQSALMEAALPLYSSAPRYIKQNLMFSYSYGTEFVKNFLLVHSWDDLKILYKNPPQTTEQIMHPEKFFNGPDLPQDAQFLAEQHYGSHETNENEVTSNILGEFTTYLLLREHLDEVTARKGAEGWDGDLVTLTEKSGENSLEILRMTFCWDSEAEAIEFREAYEQYLLNRYATQAPPDKDRGEALMQVMTDNRITISSEGSTVFISASFPQLTLTAQVR